MILIKVLFTDEEQHSLTPGRYYIGVRVKIPTIIITTGEDVPSIEASLDPHNRPAHSHPNVAMSQTRFVIFDITDHPGCPAERTMAAADGFLADHYPELDRALRGYLSEAESENF